jgi:quercetin dioxygenase-like cupin family protein
MNEPTVTRWAGAKPPTEKEVIEMFAGEHLGPRSWSNGPGDIYATHSHGYHKVLYCLRGSIVFHIRPDGTDYTLGPGDRLDLPPGVAHGATVGSAGVTCLEAAR